MNRRIKLAAVFCLVTFVSLSQANPNFPLPANGHPPGFTLHLAPIGPTAIPITGLGPIAFGDAQPNPADPHHWEVEIHNPTTTQMNFNVTLTAPGNFIIGGLTLAPFDSAYWDIHYADAPEVGPVGTWGLTAANAGGLPILFDSDVLEYPFPTAGPGPGGPVFLGPGGGAPDPASSFGPFNAAWLFVDAAIIPEPAGAGAVMILCSALLRRSRKS